MRNPLQEYQRTLENRREESSGLEALHIRLGNLRLLVAVAGAVLVWLVVARQALSPWWLLAPLVVFVVLLVRHDRVLRDRRRAGRAVVYYERAIARVEDRWMGSGETGDRFRDPEHPYAADLDLFGTGGLFELLSTARTRSGEETLARWLLSPASAETLRERQAAVEELRDRGDLREDFAVLGEDVRTGVHPEALIRWSEEPPVLDGSSARWISAALGLFMLASVVIWQVWDVFALVAVAGTAVAAYGWRQRRRVLHIVLGAEAAAHDLALLSAVLARVEREQFQSPRLAALRRELDMEGHPPSERIRRLNRLIEMLDSRDNLAMRVIGPPLLYTTQLAFAVEAWRCRSGAAVRRWLEATGEIEALGAIAGYAYERPADVLPEFASSGPLVEAEDLGHPLLPDARCVRNSVRLGDGVRVLLVSGSNMSGKSTLLRSVGTAAVMAMAGLPVRAKRLRLSPLAVGASIRVSDSLQAGTSRFYAEITRIRRIVDLAAGPVPALFLLDELLHGTNSHDRRIGAEGVIRSLVEAGAIGLLTTHDLALTHIAESLDGAAANVHFEDHIEDGKIHFDYKMRPGVVAKSNALELMRSVGLNV